MKTLYIDCGMGAAGDMLTAALLDLLSESEQDDFVEKMNSIGIPGVTVKRERTSKCGIMGNHISVFVDGVEEDEHMHKHHHDHNHVNEDHHHNHEDHDHDHHDHDHYAHEEHNHDHHNHEDHHHEHTHHHASMHDIEHLVMGHLTVSDAVKSNIMAVYQIIAEAESKVHGVPVTDIHFHEVGTMDAVADITAVCLLMEQIAADKIVVSPIHVGSGQVKCAHGILPVPAPATALILQGLPIYSGSIKGELCTPTGAALIKHFADEYSAMPQMTLVATGYGMGKKDFEVANCVRVMLGENSSEGQVTELSFNVDDMTGEGIGYMMDELLEKGALEVYLVPVQMKKNRPGNLVAVLCKNEDKKKFVKLIFKHSTTIGIRETTYSRYTMDRRIEVVDTPYGQIRKKISEGYNIKREKYEYEDISKIARENGMSIEEVKKSLL